MEAISNAELYELILILRQNLDSQFQFWLTITFALIVAVFAAGGRLSLALKVSIGTLYILATAAIISRYILEGTEIVALLDEAIRREVLGGISPIGLGLRAAAVVLGTIVTVVYLFYGERTHEESA